jgi:HK97 family phage major capsid protein
MRRIRDNSADMLKQFARQLLDSLEDDYPETGVRQLPGFLDLSPRDVARYSITQAVRKKRDEIMGRASGAGGKFDGVEAEAHRALAERFGEPEHSGAILVPADILHADSRNGRRDLNASQLGAGGALVASTTGGSFIEMLRNRAVAFLLGARPMPGLRENLTIPKQTGGSTVVWQANESVPATESTPSFVQLAASPKTAIAYVEISGQLLQQITPATDQLILGSLARDLAVAADSAVISGTGASGQPTGIMNTAGIGTASGASLGYAGVVAPQTTVCNANAVVNGSTLGYVTTPDVANLLKSRQRFTGTDSPLWRGGVYQGEIEGVPAFSSKQIPASTLLFGDWSSVVVPEWGVLEIQVNPFADFQRRVVGIRAVWSLDVIVTTPTSFVAVTGIS